MPPKKTSAKKTPAKKAAPKKTSKKTTAAIPMLSDSNANCKCKQKRNGKFYCFKLQGGHWAQVSGISFETQEECEADCCDE